MNAVSEPAPVITAANDSLRRDFPLRPFAIRHKLAGHPLLTLPRIAQLAAELPRDLIEYNSGKVAISQDPDAIPSVDLDPVEVVKRIETAGAWMVLKRVENSPEYRRLIEDTLVSVARARGFNSLRDAGFEQLEGFIFVSSPNSTTPFHLDSEDNFFVQIHGEKFFTIFDNADRSRDGPVSAIRAPGKSVGVLSAGIRSRAGEHIRRKRGCSEPYGRALVHLRRCGARDGHRDLWILCQCPAGVVAARTARLPQHVRETRRDLPAGHWDYFYSPATAVASVDPVHGWDRADLRR